MTNIVTEREIVTETLILYKNSPCLWDVTHKSYFSKEEREKHYEAMLAVYRRLDPDSTVSTLRKKLSHFRSAYRRERKKVESSLAEGREEHSPILWYYKYLTFLNDNDDSAKPDNGKDSCDEDYVRHEPVRGKKRRASETIEIYSNNEEESVNTESCELSALLQPKWNDAPPGYLRSYGETIARQLQELATPVRYEVERIIADVIYRARTGTLQRYNPQIVENLIIPSSGPSWYDVQDQTDTPAAGPSIIKVEYDSSM